MPTHVSVCVRVCVCFKDPPSLHGVAVEMVSVYLLLSRGLKEADDRNLMLKDWIQGF